MSGIAGIIHLDNQAPDSRVLDRMCAHLSDRGPESTHIWSGEHAGMVYAHFASSSHTNDFQSFYNSARHLLLVFDGRLDRRPALIHALRDSEELVELPEHPADEELALAAYMCWRERAPEKLEGDFAAALWDPRARKLFCFRDRFAQRPFYYSWNGKTFAFASEIRALLDVPGVSKRPNPGMAAEYLSGNFRSHSETLYHDIRRLPPAHSLTLDLTGPRFEPRIRRYWDLDPAYKLAPASDQDFATRYGELFHRAVADRLNTPSQAPELGADFSGGLDSSSIAGVAEDFEVPMRLFSMRFPGWICDEGEYQRSGEAFWEARHETCHPLAPSRGRLIENARQFLDFPGLPTLELAAPLFEKARQCGIRVMLGGLGGDDLLTGSELAYADHLKAGEFSQFVQRATGHARAPGLLRALRRGLGPLLKREKEDTPETPEYLLPQLLSAANWPERMKQRVEKKFERLAQQELYEQSQCADLALMTELSERAVSAAGLEYRYPFYDRELYEFSFALPEEQRVRDGKIKFILRNAMDGYVPPRILSRTDKADFHQPFNAWVRAVGEGEDFAPLGDLGWVDPARARESFQTWLKKVNEKESSVITEGWNLWLLCGISIWAREAL
jgi:asparagine synthase (glutamine-hydrolysing)